MVTEIETQLKKLVSKEIALTINKYKIIVVFATRSTSSEYQNLLIANCLTKLQFLSAASDFDFSIIPIFENKDGLSKAYNKQIELLKDQITDNNGCVVFMHDDVAIQDLYFSNKLQEYHKQFDIIGVAGSTIINSKAEKLAWHTSPRTSLAGSVIHLLPNCKQGFPQFYTNSYGPSPRLVMTIDGLFMSISFKSLFKNNLRFDEDFDFDFYDMSLCAKATLECMTIGVIPLIIYHVSHGNGINSPKYKINDKLFRDKYIDKLKAHFTKM